MIFDSFMRGPLLWVILDEEEGHSDYMIHSWKPPKYVIFDMIRCFFNFITELLVHLAYMKQRYCISLLFFERELFHDVL